jgi:hypothetical protein
MEPGGGIALRAYRNPAGCREMFRLQTDARTVSRGGLIYRMGIRSLPQIPASGTDTIVERHSSDLLRCTIFRGYERNTGAATEPDYSRATLG